MATYTPDDETAALYARYKRAKETAEKLLPLVKKTAVRDMRDAGATVGALRQMTGITDEVFRRLARENGIERLREPTVGYEVEAKRSRS